MFEKWWIYLFVGLEFCPTLRFSNKRIIIIVVVAIVIILSLS